MTDNTENLIVEILRKIQGEQAAARERDREIITRLGHIEAAVARLGRDQNSAWEEQIDDRHSVDKLRERVERIERRLELTD